MGGDEQDVRAGAEAPADARRPRSVYGVGTEPDARFSLANERTALAWVRTGLGLVAGGVALTSFATFADMPGVLDVVAGVACLAGAGFAGYALVSWRRNERALRLRRRLPAPSGLPVLVVGVVILALLLAGYAVGSATGS
ncbi:YidH family protein [Cellulosimicrobium sp. NPDC057862]|uniref:YidH family protein n=1 Tax=Cellulosimicrobium sp. NPDC057862 TaxID=3346266 RepID=UPI00366C4BA8